MKITVSLVYAVIVLSGIILIPNAFAENVPEWIKNTAGWWADDQIPDSAFLQGIQFLIKEGIMLIPSTEISGSSETLKKFQRGLRTMLVGGQMIKFQKKNL